MVTRRTHVSSLFVALLTTSAAVFTGCASSKHADGGAHSRRRGVTDTPSNPASAGAAGGPVAGTQVAPEASVSSADILARKAQSYADSLTPLIAQRSGTGIDERHPEVPPEARDASSAAAPQLAGKPSDVAWEGSSQTAAEDAPSMPITTVKEVETSTPTPAPNSAPTATAGFGASAVKTKAPSSVSNPKVDGAARTNNPPKVYAAPASNRAESAVITDGGAKLHSVAETTPGGTIDDAIKASAKPGAANADAATPADAALASKLAENVKDDPRDAASQLDLQLLRFIHGDSTPDQAALANLPQEDRDTLNALIDGLANYRSQLRADDNMLLNKKVKPLLDMAERLRASTDLEVSKIAVCREVAAFGQYEPIEPARLEAKQGQDFKPIIYCEVSNFSSTPNERSIWETKLKYSASLYKDDGDGIEVWRGKPAEITDMCRNRRKDFFIRDYVVLPQTLSLGGYLFKVTVTDEQANRVAEATVPIQIVVR